MKRILKYLWKYKLLYIIPIISMFIAIALDMFNPVIYQKIIDDVIKGGNHGILSKLLLALLGITIGRAVFGYIREFLFDYAGSKVTFDIRNDLFRHIQKLPFNYFDGINTGELMSRTTEDINNIWNAIGFAIMFFIEQILYLIIATTLLLTIDWKLALICLSIMPPMLYLAMKLEKKIGEAYEKLSDQSAVLNTTAQENLAGVRLVKAFGREKYELEKFFKQNQENYELNLNQARIWGKYHPVIEFFSNLVLVVVISVGGIFVVGNQITLGELVKFNGYIMMLIWPLRLMGWLTNIIARCNASAKRIFAIMDIEPEIKNPPNPVFPTKIQGKIVFDNVSFKYKDQYVLKNINLHVEPGSTIAIMGTTGAGKTSMVNLIGRYYDCTEGRVLFDGVDVKSLDLEFLRDNISVVMQDTFLFSDTIEENIKFATGNVRTEEFDKVVVESQVDEFVKEMEEGYQTVIGERGIGLSGGQKQRISIARALLKKAKVLILDDATSALDMETEYQIQKALEKRKDITKIIIAHRISAVKNADEIIVLDKGEIVERGSHKALLMKKGKYYEIYCEQFKDLDISIDGLKEGVI
ncbi:ATP-binding cassette, subfamily B [Anaerobranca californiensis DSM 14826]|uniref:ATP-binding cassette, subfamily B n=1 Tax=Anaerobranca californiensis DSM 14826 TaxID=1120989 RepID=A0A1M6QD51_9FIRM|nr:ABC transporter ATP-binding protein [Anaerobranca californiensis]SHK18234.1 ATP-binding cassette, subfamily B [Anaerobranca californiensis DSM 14826]